jgi:hypothetical protein
VILIVVVILVAFVLVPTLLSALVYFDISNLTKGPGSTPLGAAFATGPPAPGICSTANASTGACVVPGDWTYQLQVVASAVTLSSVYFEVRGSSGAPFQNPGTGSFALVSLLSGSVVASTHVNAGALEMAPGWTNYASGYSSASPITSTMAVVIDTGQSSPTTALGLVFVALGTGSYSGSIQESLS